MEDHFPSKHHFYILNFFPLQPGGSVATINFLFTTLPCLERLFPVCLSLSLALPPPRSLSSLSSPALPRRGYGSINHYYHQLLIALAGRLPPPPLIHLSRRPTSHTLEHILVATAAPPGCVRGSEKFHVSTCQNNRRDRPETERRLRKRTTAGLRGCGTCGEERGGGGE